MGGRIFLGSRRLTKRKKAGRRGGSEGGSIQNEHEGAAARIVPLDSYDVPLDSLIIKY